MIHDHESNIPGDVSCDHCGARTFRMITTRVLVVEATYPLPDTIEELASCYTILAHDVPYTVRCTSCDREQDEETAFAVYYAIVSTDVGGQLKRAMDPHTV